MKYVINGSFLTEPGMGVQRYAYEITKQLDKMCQGMDISILVPDQPGNSDYGYKNIKVIHKGKSGGKKWEQTTYAFYLLLKGAKGINLCNTVPLIGNGGIVCVHDICFKTHPEYFTQKGDWREAAFRRIMYKKAFRTADTIVTVSRFSKNEILANYRPKNCNILVAGNSWQHFDCNSIDESILTDNQAGISLKPGEYYFYMASLAPNKNLKWILANAAKYPHRTYVLSGRPLGDDNILGDLKNVHYVGYVNDLQAKALMKNCRAFLFPSTYEGFGIPPMEALCMGAKIVLGDIEVFHEIYGKGAYYVDTQNPDTDIDRLIESEVLPAKEILNKYSWEKSAKKIFDKL